MTEEGFYDLVPGRIGTINYFVDVSNRLTAEQKQAIVSKQANARLRAALMNGAEDPAAAYSAARGDSWAEVDKLAGREMRQFDVQVGNKESYEMLRKIEARKDFVEWGNPLFVTLLRDTYESLNKKKDENNK